MIDILESEKTLGLLADAHRKNPKDSGALEAYELALENHKKEIESIRHGVGIMNADDLARAKEHKASERAALESEVAELQPHLESKAVAVGVALASLIPLLDDVAGEYAALSSRLAKLGRSYEIEKLIARVALEIAKALPDRAHDIEGWFVAPSSYVYHATYDQAPLTSAFLNGALLERLRNSRPMGEAAVAALRQRLEIRATANSQSAAEAAIAALSKSPPAQSPTFGEARATRRGMLFRSFGGSSAAENGPADGDGGPSAA